MVSDQYGPPDVILQQFLLVGDAGYMYRLRPQFTASWKAWDVQIGGGIGYAIVATSRSTVVEELEPIVEIWAPDVEWNDGLYLHVTAIVFVSHVIVFVQCTRGIIHRCGYALGGRF